VIKIICDKCNNEIKKEEVIVIENHLCKDCVKQLNQANEVKHG